MKTTIHDDIPITLETAMLLGVAFTWGTRSIAVKLDRKADGEYRVLEKEITIDRLEKAINSGRPAARWRQCRSYDTVEDVRGSVLAYDSPAVLVTFDDEI